MQKRYLADHSMDLSFYISGLSANRDVFAGMYNGLGPAQLRWRPADSRWNLHEVICHLYDEEKEDFRYRLGHILESPDLAMPSIDPPGWVQSHDYASKDTETVLRSFLKEREDSVAWLATRADASWDNVHNHPRLGPLHARGMLASWLAHDFLHFRQISRIRLEYLQFISAQSTAYAGTW